MMTSRGACSDGTSSGSPAVIEGRLISAVEFIGDGDITCVGAAPFTGCRSTGVAVPLGLVGWAWAAASSWMARS